MNSLEGVMVVGLTGQTGAGKTTVCKVFERSGFSVINADAIARQVMDIVDGKIVVACGHNGLIRI